MKLFTAIRVFLCFIWPALKLHGCLSPTIVQASGKTNAYKKQTCIEDPEEQEQIV